MKKPNNDSPSLNESQHCGILFLNMYYNGGNIGVPLGVWISEICLEDEDD